MLVSASDWKGDGGALQALGLAHGFTPGFLRASRVKWSAGRLQRSGDTYFSVSGGQRPAVDRKAWEAMKGYRVYVVPGIFPVSSLEPA